MPDKMMEKCDKHGHIVVQSCQCKEDAQSAINLINKIKSLEQALDGAERDLRFWGQHKRPCPKFDRIKANCTCGFDDALAAIKKARSGK